jgi:hypothetical protein
MTHKLLEILIPTYRRPQAAIAAIDSVIASADPRVAVACHSNGPDAELERAATDRPRLRYGSFPENRGAIANFRKMLEDSSADYVLFLSDEDQVDHAHLAGFLDFLSSRQHGFVFCNVVESTGLKYFSISPFRGETLTARDLLVLFTIHPTYISGYCYRRDLLTSGVIRESFELNDANVYPHLLLRNAIASRASIGLFAENIVVKGQEANAGGDSHAHVKQSATEQQAHARRLLNPRIYGESARARQFYYLVPRLDKDLASLSAFQRAFVRFYVLSAWLKITIDAHLHVDAGTNVPALSCTIEHYRRENAHTFGLIGCYNRVLAIRQKSFRNGTVKLMCHVARLAKLTIFIKRFGLSRTFAFLSDKSV